MVFGHRNRVIFVSSLALAALVCVSPAVNLAAVSSLLLGYLLISKDSRLGFGLDNYFASGSGIVKIHDNA